jgi:DNA repair protein RadC
MNQITFEFGNDGDAGRRDFTLPLSEQPPQRLENYGPGAASDTELLAMMLQSSGTRPCQALALAAQLLTEAGSIHTLLTWGVADYRRLKGIGRIKALQLTTVAEIARRMMAPQSATAPILNRPEALVAHLAPIAAGLTVEKFWVFCLSRRNRLIKRIELTSGTTTQTLAHPRDVFRAAIREAGTTGIACAHNHPSGDPSPSAPDLHVTRLIRDAARAIDVEFLDHVIIGRVDADPTGLGYYSFRAAGVL